MVLEIFNPNCTTPRVTVVCSSNLPAWHGDFFWYNVTAFNATAMNGLIFNGSLASQAMIYTASSLLPPQLVTQLTITCNVSGPDAYKFDPVPPINILIKPQSPFNLSTLAISYPINTTQLSTGSYATFSATGIESVIPSQYFVYSGEYFALNVSVTEPPNFGKNITIYAKMNCINVAAFYLNATTKGYCSPDFFSVGVAASLNPITDPNVTISYLDATIDAAFNTSSPYQIWIKAPIVSNATNISIVFYLKGPDLTHYNIDILNSWSGVFRAGIVIPIKPRSQLSWQNVPINMTINQVYSLTSLSLLEQPNDNYGRLRGVPNTWGFNLTVVVTPVAGLLPLAARYPTFFFGLPTFIHIVHGPVTDWTDQCHLHCNHNQSGDGLCRTEWTRSLCTTISATTFSFTISPYGKLIATGICTYMQLFSNCTFSIVLDQQPFRNGSLNVAGAMYPDGAMTPTSFYFDCTNSNIPQTLTIYAPTSITSPAFNLGVSNVGFPHVAVSFVLTGQNQYQFAPFQNVSVLILSQVHIRDLPTSLYVGQISTNPFVVRWDGSAYGSVSLNAIISPANYGYLSTVPLTYNGLLTSDNVRVHAPTNLLGGSNMTLTFSLSGPDASKFESTFYLAPKLVSGQVNYVQTNSFVINSCYHKVMSRLVEYPPRSIRMNSHLPSPSPYRHP